MATRENHRFDRRATDYDRSRYQSTLFQRLHELTLQQACRAAPHPEAVLDLGCGTGQFLRRAAAAFPGAELVGVDPSPEMIKAAQAATPSDTNVRFLIASAEALPLPDHSFDLAVTTGSFHHWADQSRGLAEVHRVLRPGSALVLADMLATGLLRFGWLAWLAGRLDGGRFIKPEVLDEMLSGAGFRIAQRALVPHFSKAVQITVACCL